MADTLPATLRGVMAGDSTLTSELTTYVPANVPAIFQGRAPADHSGFPYLVFDLDELDAGGDNHYLKRNVSFMINCWDKNEGHSYAKLQTIARRLIELFDRQRITDTDYEAARVFLDDQRIVEEVNEEDNVLHLVVAFTILGFRQYLATHLTS